jgi:hypothetical protein
MKTYPMMKSQSLPDPWVNSSHNSLAICTMDVPGSAMHQGAMVANRSSLVLTVQRYLVEDNCVMHKAGYR